MPDLKIEKPTLDLPEAVPDVFGMEKVNFDPLIKDIEILLAINDVTGAKKLYRRLRKLYDGLPEEDQQENFSKVEKIYKKISTHNSFSSKLKRMFKK